MESSVVPPGIVPGNIRYFNHYFAVRSRNYIRLMPGLFLIREEQYTYCRIEVLSGQKHLLTELCTLRYKG